MLFAKDWLIPVNVADPFTSTSVINRKQFEEFSEPHLKDLVEGIKKLLVICLASIFVENQKEFGKI